MNRVYVCYRHFVPLERFRCPECGGTTTTLIYVEPPQEDVDGEEVDSSVWAVEGPLGDWFPGGSDKPYHVPPGKVSFWSGPPGSGKTSLAMSAMPRAAIVANEMGETDIRAYRRRLAQVWEYLPEEVTVLEPVSAPYDIPHHRVKRGHVVGLRDAITGDHVDPGAYRELIVDSVSKCADSVQAASWLIGWAAATGGRAIGILWQTSDGNSWGGNAIIHEGWQEVELGRDSTGRRVITTHKDRSNRLGSMIFPLPGEEIQALNCYVSVEGKPPAYFLRPWPNFRGWGGLGSAEHADLLKAIEKGKAGDIELPPPPVAVAASQSKLYACGWIEPADWKDRARFAIESGAPYYSPVYDRLFEDTEELDEVDT